MHSSLLHVTRIFPERTQERGEIKILKKMFVQMFLVIIEEGHEKTSELGKSKGNGEKLKGWGRARSNIHKDTKNHVIMDVWKGSRKKGGKGPELPWRQRLLKRLGAHGSRAAQKERWRRDGWRSFQGEKSVVRRQEPSPSSIASREAEGLE